MLALLTKLFAINFDSNCRAIHEKCAHYTNNLVIHMVNVINYMKIVYIHINRVHSSEDINQYSYQVSNDQVIA